MNKSKLYILVISILLFLSFVLSSDAIADVGYHFSGLSGDLSGTQNPAIVTIDKDTNIIANFAPITVFPTDYVSYWKLDTETEGVTPDETGTNDGTLVGDATIINDIEKGSLLTLDGTEDYIEVADNPSLDIQHQITLSAWVKLNKFSGTTKIVVKPTETGADPWELYALDIREDTQKVRFILSNGGLYANNDWHAVTSAISAGEWYHVVGTYDGTTMRLYLNNSLVSTKDVTLTIATNNQPLLIGRWLTGSSINGLIDDLMIFNRALGEAEIDEIYQAQRPVIAPEDEYMIGLFLMPTAMNYLKDGVYTNYDHSIFIDGYEEMIDTLSSFGFNTIIIDTRHMIYRYEFDAGLSNIHYPTSRGFNSTEMKEMAQIARQKGMKVIPALDVITDQAADVLSRVYPEYMLPEPGWEEGRNYKLKDHVEVGEITYRSKIAHTSSLNNKPGYGTNWKDYWQVSYRRTRDPFNQQGEQMLFRMIDELIEVFTVDGVKPEAIHMESDELSNWLDCPVQCNGMSSAEVFAMTITNVYNHIKQNNPDMDVIMWADMLDENWYGGKEKTPVAGAVDLLPKDIILDDWRYETTYYYGYDFENKEFPSVGKFMDKGYNVIVSPWRDPDAAKDLIWTGKKEGLRTGKFEGVIYPTFLMDTVPSLSQALSDYPGWEDLMPDSYRYSKDPSTDVRMQGVADVIKQTVYIINLKQCRGTDGFCGLYPN